MAFADYRQYTSDVTAVASTVTQDFIDPARPHCFVGIRFFDDAAGTIMATPTAGTVLVEVQTINSYPDFQDVISNEIDVTGQCTIDWGANTKAVRATPTGITGATHYQMFVTGNKT